MEVNSDRSVGVEGRAVFVNGDSDLTPESGLKGTDGTFFELKPRFFNPLHPPIYHLTRTVEIAMRIVCTSLPTELRRRVTWDQGPVVTIHAQIAVAALTTICF